MPRLPCVALVGWLLLGAATGLDRPFPPLSGEAPTPERVALGRLLFFDPVLSEDGSLSCAHCHRPDRAFSDGRATAQGRGGRALARNVPSLWNVGVKPRLMWDRRVGSLEEQARIPLLAADEMSADPERLQARLAALPEYRARFAAAFRDDPWAADRLTLANVTRALAAFERTLLSRDSRYDRYARGEKSALTPAERRGLALFRSLNTRCFECHRPPTFDAPLALGIGVPSPDRGVGLASGEPAQDGLFGVPSLRNVALTAPYMHDGSLPTLAAVVDFYRQGGGRARGVSGDRIDGQVRAFAISDAEAADLVAFLGALSDESTSPSVPGRVPSGLPIVRMERKP